MVNPEPFYAELEAQSEAVTQDKVDARLYSGGRHELAIAWLERKRQARVSEAEARNEASQSEQIEFARRAALAAERAAEAAEVAAAEARRANDLALEASSVARDANLIASTANTLAERSNNQSRTANDTARNALIASAVSAIIAILALALTRR